MFFFFSSVVVTATRRAVSTGHLLVWPAIRLSKREALGRRCKSLLLFIVASNAVMPIRTNGHPAERSKTSEWEIRSNAATQDRQLGLGAVIRLDLTIPCCDIFFQGFEAFAFTSQRASLRF